MKNLFFAIVTIGLFISCSSNEDKVNPTGTKKILKATELTGSFPTTFNFIYNSDGFLSEIGYVDSRSSGSFNLLYNAEGFLIQYHNHIYEYDSQNRIIGSYWKNPADGSLSADATYEYNTDGKMIAVNSGREVIFTNGNYENLGTAEFTYDNKRNAFASVPLYSLTGYFDPYHEVGLVFPSTNNVIQEYIPEIDPSTGLDRSVTINYIYVYDDEGYPTSCLVDGITTMLYEYVK